MSRLATPRKKPHAYPLQPIILPMFFIAVVSILALWNLKPAPYETIVSRFQMIDYDGRLVSEKDFLGQPLLVLFGYTHCQSVCPAQLLTVSKALQELGDDAQIRAIFVTVDPERDSLDLLHDFLSRFDPRINGLRGDQSALSEMMRSFRISATKMGQAANDYWIDHVTAIFLIDKKGQFVKIVDANRKPQAIALDLRRYL